MSVETSEAIDAHGMGQPAQWWESRAAALLLTLLATVPLLYPRIPPLVDLLGHMGRYRVELDIQRSQFLELYYGFHWAAIGNLGVDLLIMVVGPLLGLEPAIKLIVLLIPPMTVAGFLWVAREVHGRVPPTAYFAIPFAYGHPFMFGFVNFALSMALAFLAFGLWLRLARLGRTRLRAWLFVPISVIVFFTHTYGWGALGLLCFSAEAVRQHDRGVGWFRAGVNAALQASVMALPILITIVWRSEVAGGTTSDWWNWMSKWRWLKYSLRDRWEYFDISSLCATVVLLISALVSRRLAFSRNLAFSGLVLSAAFVALPRILFASAYADMRLTPYLFAVFLLAIRFKAGIDRRVGGALAALGILFCLIRLSANTISLAQAADDQQAKLQALDHVPIGARIASFVGLPCGYSWALPRNSHLGAMAIVRRDGFSNDQWLVEGVNLLDLKYAKPGYFAADPSNIVRPDRCPDRLHRTIDQSLAEVPRDAFDYIWLIDIAPTDPKSTVGLHAVWRGPGSVLYRLH